MHPPRDRACAVLAQYCAGGILLGMIPSMHYRRYSPAMFAGLVGTAVDYYVWYDETRVERARLGVLRERRKSLKIQAELSE